MFPLGAQQQQQPSYGMYESSPDTVGGLKGTFLRFKRRRMNLVAVACNIILPWALFTFVFSFTSFSIHYTQPSLSSLGVGLAFGLVLIAAGAAVSSRSIWFSKTDHDPSWLVFLAVTMLMAWVGGYMLGNMNFSANMRPYYDVMNLNNYANVYPDKMRGQQLMDAGRVTFAKGTKLDLAKSLGFKNNEVYCVAPIVLGSNTLNTYDFWAVGKGCCSGANADFHCGSYNDPKANGGLRLMDDGDRQMYRLAVQQAEALYAIKAVHPIFFEWVEDPEAIIGSWQITGQSQFIRYAASYLVLQIFLVVAACLAFSKIGAP